jgi:hypothetical protein
MDDLTKHKDILIKHKDDLTEQTNDLIKHKNDLTKHNDNKDEAIPVTGREGPCSCETSRLAHYLDNRLTDGGEVVSLTLRPTTLQRQ